MFKIVVVTMFVNKKIREQDEVEHQPYKIGRASVEDKMGLFPVSAAARIRKDGFFYLVILSTS